MKLMKQEIWNQLWDKSEDKLWNRVWNRVLHQVWNRVEKQFKIESVYDIRTQIHIDVRDRSYHP